MKLLFLFLFSAFQLFSFSVFGGVNFVTVATSTNGSLITPTNFFQANIKGLSNAMAAAGYSPAPAGVVTNYQTVIWSSPAVYTNEFMISNCPTTYFNTNVFFCAAASTNGQYVWTNTAANGTNIYLVWNDTNIWGWDSLNASTFSIASSLPANLSLTNFYLNLYSQQDSFGNFINLFGPVWADYNASAIGLQVYGLSPQIVISNSTFVITGKSFTGGSFAGDGGGLTNISGASIASPIALKALPPSVQTNQILWEIDGDSYTSDFFIYSGCVIGSWPGRTNSYMWMLYSNYNNCGRVKYVDNAFPGRLSAAFIGDYTNSIRPTVTNWSGTKYYFVMGGFNDLETSLANSNTVFGYLTNVIAAANADGCITVLGIQPLGPQSNPANLNTNNLNQYNNWLGLCTMLRSLTNQTPSCPAYIVDVAAHYAEYTWLCDQIHPDNLANASIAALYDQVLGGRGSHISQNGTTNQPSKAATIFDTANVIASTFTGSHIGNSAGLTNLPAANLVGTVPAANLPGSLPALSTNNAISSLSISNITYTTNGLATNAAAIAYVTNATTGAVRAICWDDDSGYVATTDNRALNFSSSSNTFAGNGAGLTNLPWTRAFTGYFGSTIYTNSASFPNIYYPLSGGANPGNQALLFCTTMTPGWYGQVRGGMSVGGVAIAPSTNFTATLFTNRLGVSTPIATPLTLIFSNAISCSSYSLFSQPTNLISLYIPDGTWGVWVITNNVAANYSMQWTLSLDYHP